MADSSEKFKQFINNQKSLFEKINNLNVQITNSNKSVVTLESRIVNLEQKLAELMKNDISFKKFMSALDNY